MSRFAQVDIAYDIVRVTRFVFFAALLGFLVLDVWMISNGVSEPALTGMGLLIFGVLLALGWVFIIGGRRHFVYRMAIRGALARFVLASILTVLVLLPYGAVTVLSLVLPLVAFAIILGASGSWFIYAEYLSLEHARELITLGLMRKPSTETAIVCRRCLSLQPPGNSACWLCETPLDRESSYELRW